MSPLTIRELMDAPWHPVIEADQEGGFRLTLPPLNDFVLYADSEAQLREDWREALESHLQGYLTTGKVPPYPGRVRLVEHAEAGTSSDERANTHVTLGDHLDNPLPAGPGSASLSMRPRINGARPRGIMASWLRVGGCCRGGRRTTC